VRRVDRRPEALARGHPAGYREDDARGPGLWHSTAQRHRLACALPSTMSWPRYCVSSAFPVALAGLISHCTCCGNLYILIYREESGLSREEGNGSHLMGQELWWRVVQVKWLFSLSRGAREEMVEGGFFFGKVEISPKSDGSKRSHRLSSRG
jgi:hypothetical protein